MYLLTNKYFDTQSCEWKIIKEAVWKGSSVEVLFIMKKTESDSHCDNDVIFSDFTILPENEYKFYACRALGEANVYVGEEKAEPKMFPLLELAKVISVKDVAHEDDVEYVYGHIFTREHTMILEAKPFYKHHGSTPVIFETLLLNREWATHGYTYFRDLLCLARACPEKAGHTKEIAYSFRSECVGQVWHIFCWSTRQGREAVELLN